MKLTEEQIRTIEPYRSILSILRKGADNSTSVIVLCAKTGLTDRVLRKCIEVIRKSGICVVSCSKGYYFPETEDELERFIERMEKTARSYFYSLRTAKRELRRMKERSQMKIEE